MAFSATVTSPMSRAERISRSMGIYAGKVSIASYATTLVECTAITKYFKPTGNGATGGFKNGIVSVQIDGPSSGGFLVNWDYTTGAFRCYSPATIVFSGSATGAGVTVISAASVWTFAAVSKTGTHQATAVQAIANDAIGTFGFVAIGYI